MSMIDTFVDIRVRISSFKTLAHLVAQLPEPFRPIYFSKGGRISNKDASRVDDSVQFSDFVDERVDRVSGFDLIGQRIRFGFFVGETRTASHESTHVGCSIILRGRQWTPADFVLLLKLLCSVPGTERAEACRRDEWEHRHLYVKNLQPISIQTTLGIDMSSTLPSLYWWTVFSKDLIERHSLDVEELSQFSKYSERWYTVNGEELHAFKLYDSVEDWKKEERGISYFLESHLNFFSMARINAKIADTRTKEDFDKAVKPYRAGYMPW